MASPAAMLQILVDVQTSRAAGQLGGLQKQLHAAGGSASSMERQTAQAARGASMLGSSASKASGGVSSMDRRSASAARSAGSLGSSANKSIGSVSGLARAALAAGGAFAAWSAAKSAVTFTVELTHATEKLSAITGMDTKTASTWIEMMRARGVSLTQVQMGFITLAKNVSNAEKGSKTASGAFRSLGVSMQTLRSGDTNKIILSMADGFTKIHDPAQRAALAQQLFGRNAKAMIPILVGGSAAIKAQLGLTQQYGAYIGGDANKKLLQYQSSLFQFRYALDGLKITFTEAVLPYLAKGITAFDMFIQQVRKGTGAGGVFGKIISGAFRVAKDAIGGFINLVGGLGNFLRILGALLATFLAFRTVRAIITGVALALDPMTWVVAGIAAAAYLIIKNWKTVGPFFIALANTMRTVLGTALHVILTLAASALRGLAAMAGALSNIPGVSSVFGSIRDQLNRAADSVDGVRRKIDQIPKIQHKTVNVKVVQQGAPAAAQGAAQGASVGTPSAAIKAQPSVWQQILGTAERIWGQIESVITSVLKTIKQAFDQTLGPVFNAFKTGIQGVISAVGPAWTAFAGAMALPLHMLGGAFHVLLTVIGAVMTQIGIIVSAGWEVVKGAFTLAWHLVENIMNTIAGVVRGGFQIIKGVLELFAGLFTLDFGKMWQGIKDIFGGALRGLVAMVRGIWGALVAAGQFVMDGLKAGITAVWATIKNIVHTIVNSIVAVVRGIWGGLEAAGKFIFSGLKNGISSVGGALKSVASAIVNSIVSVVKGVWNALFNAGKFIFEGLKAGISAVWNALKSIVTSIANSFVSVVNGVWNAMYNAGKFVLNAVGDGVKAAVNAVIGVVVGFINAIISVIDKIPGVSIGSVSAPQLARGGVVAGGVQKFAGGGMVMAPGYFAGEEAPQHPEVILATNPRYRERNLKLWETAGKMLGVPGFAWGGFGGVGGGPTASGPIKAKTPALPGVLSTLEKTLGVAILGSPASVAGQLGSQLVSRLPGAPSLPSWIAGLPGFLLGKAGDWIKKHVLGLIGLREGGIFTGSGIRGFATGGVYGPRDWQQSILGEPGLPYIKPLKGSTADAARVAGMIAGERNAISSLENQASNLESFYGIGGHTLTKDQTDTVAYVRKLIWSTWSALVANEQVLGPAYTTIIKNLNKALGKAKGKLKGKKGGALTAQQKVVQQIGDQVSHYTDLATGLAGSLLSDRDSRDSAWVSYLSTAASGATGGGGTGGTGATVDLSGALANLTALATQQKLGLAISQAQYKTLAQAPAGLLTGAFAFGGVQPRTGWALVGERGPELAHLPGGTRIYPNTQSTGSPGGQVIQVLIEDGAVDPNKIRVIASDEAQVVVRQAVRAGSRGLPGAGGGVIRH